MGKRYYKREDWAGNVYYEEDDGSDGYIPPVVVAFFVAFLLMPIGFIGTWLPFMLDFPELIVCGLALLWMLVVGVFHEATTSCYSDGFWKYTNYYIFFIEATLLIIYHEEILILDLPEVIITSILLLAYLLFGKVLLSSLLELFR